MSVKVYTKNMCGYCVQAKNFLKSKNIDFEEDRWIPAVNRIRRI
jgi:glutaredoxin